MEVFFTLTAH